MAPTKVWLDCDPGRDDAVAILFALHLPQIELVGISVVHGNCGTSQLTFNACRLLASFGTAEQSKRIPVCAGTHSALVTRLEPGQGGAQSAAQSGKSVHGDDGLGGVMGLLPKDDPRVVDLHKMAMRRPAADMLRQACEALAPGEKLTLVATGPMTNVANFLSAYPELALDKIDEMVLMAGAEGRGNKTPVAEANVANDPEAAHIVFNFALPVVIAPLNMTHTAIFTRDVHARLRDPAKRLPEDDDPTSPDYSTLPAPSSDLRLCLSTNMTFYAQSYRDKYGFLTGPPCHDPHCIAYVANKHAYNGKRYRVDVELAGKHTYGATVVDLWEYKRHLVDQDPNNWGPTGKNVFVLEQVDSKQFWDLFLRVVDDAEKVCPIGTAAAAA